MAAVVKKSILGAMYGAGADIAAEIAADTSLPSSGFTDPPSGIKNGIAQLDELKFDVFKTGENEGKPYFSATGMILEPLSHVYTPTSMGQPTGDPIEVQTAGMRTQGQIDGQAFVPMFDSSPKSGKNMGKVTTLKEHAIKVAQFMRGLGVDTSKVKTLADLEALAERVTRIARDPKTPIYFRFSTSVRKAQNANDADGVWQNWNGIAGLENYSPPDGSVIATNDGSGEVQTITEADVGTIDAATLGVQDESSKDLSEVSLEDLVDAATSENQDAQDELLRRAAEATGRDVDDINSTAQSWAEVAELAAGGSTEEEAVAKTPPKKGDHFNYRPMVKGIGGRMNKAKKAVECVVTVANEAKRTVDLKNTVDGKTIYKAVSWDDLEEVS